MLTERGELLRATINAPIGVRYAPHPNPTFSFVPVGIELNLPVSLEFIPLGAPDPVVYPAIVMHVAVAAGEDYVISLHANHSGS